MTTRARQLLESPEGENVPEPAGIFALRLLLFALCYVAAAELGHWLTVESGDFATIWPPAGVYLAALLLTPAARWGWVVAAAVTANMVSDVVLQRQALSLGIGFSCINTMSALCIGTLLRRYSPTPPRLESLRGVLTFAAFSAAVETIVSGPAGALLIQWHYGARFFSTWSHWTLADIAGIWLTAPLLLVIAQQRLDSVRLKSPWRLAEIGLLVISLAGVSYGMFFRQVGWFSCSHLPVLWLLWAALRFGVAGVSVGMAVLAVVAGRATAKGVGIFTEISSLPDQSVVLLLVYLGSWFAVFHVVAAVLHEWRGALQKLSAVNVSLEQRVAARTAELTSTNAALVEAMQASHAASRAKDEFLAALSHELRTPLTPVLLVASTAQRDTGLPQGVRDDFAMIQRNVMLEARLIDDLLDLTRIAHGRVEITSEEVDLHQIIQRTIDASRAELEQKKLQLVTGLSAAARIVSGDPVRLQQIVWNLLKNAVKFTDEGGRIFVGTRNNRAGTILIEVRDSGIGIAPEELNQIFKKFEQGTHGRQFGGLGLGLAISQSLVELHGGSICADSAGRGTGATFHVELPLITPSGVVGGPGPMPTPPAGRALEILLLEDHEPTRETLMRLLTRRGHRVTPVGTIAAARQLVFSRAFDLLLSDLALPDGDACQLMRDVAVRGFPPGIAFSGFGMEDDVRRCRDAGFRHHLTKPVDFALLESVLQSDAIQQPPVGART